MTQETTHRIGSAVNPSEMATLAGLFDRVAFEGKPGSGKTSVAKQVGDSLKTELDFKHINCAEKTLEDFLGLPCRDERGFTVYCPNAELVSTDGRPVFLVLDEAASATADVQKVLCALIRERKLGGYQYPAGTRTIALWNSTSDKAGARPVLSTLITSMPVYAMEADLESFSLWGKQAIGSASAKRAEQSALFQEAASDPRIDSDVLAFLQFRPAAQQREGANQPFSTPRSWRLYVAARRALRRAEVGDSLIAKTAYALLSPEDAGVLNMMYAHLPELGSPEDYLTGESDLPSDLGERWFVLHGLRSAVERGSLKVRAGDPALRVFFRARVGREEGAALMVGLAEEWAALGVHDGLRDWQARL